MPARIISLVLALSLTACGGGASRQSGEPPAAAPSNQAPVAMVGSTDVVAEGERVVLDGSASRDSEGSISNYSWTQTAGATVALSSRHTSVVSFLAPAVDSRSTLGFRLTVTDTAGAQSTDEVEVVVVPRQVSLSGTITALPGSAMDGDLNDPNAPRQSNDTPAHAQLLGNPVTVGGYVNVPGAGEAGPSFTGGDASDFFRVSLEAHQSVTLLVADPEQGDADLYLWDADGSELLGASIDTNRTDSVEVASTGEYVLEVHAYRGATNYTLLVGQPGTAGTASGLSLAGDFLPDQAVVQRRVATQAGMSAATARDVPVSPGAAAGSRSPSPELVRFADAVRPAGPSSARAAGAEPSRLSTVGEPRQRDKLRTLLAIKALRDDPGVEHAQPNFRVQPQSVPDDPLYPLQWHYPLIDLPGAWSFTRGDAAVRVAVVDSGVLPRHPDLQGRLLPGYDFVSSADNGADGDGIDADPSDPGNGEEGQASSFHGTHVAGTVAATADNASGGSGVAPGVSIVPVRSLGITGGSSYDIIQGVRYAAGLANDSGTTVAPVDVINLSLGRRGRCWPSEQAAFDAAREAGVLVVAAAGNDGIDAADAFPANCEHVLAVGAVDRDGRPTHYSNHGSRVDLLAPGGQGFDRDGDGHSDGVLSLTADDSAGPALHGYGFKHGTSMASPHVAGVLALMRSVEPALSPAEVDRLLAEGSLTDESGLIDARRAVLAALGLPERTPGERVVATPGSLQFGSAYTYAEFEISADGAAASVDSVAAADDWLRVRPVEVASSGTGTYAVTVDRAGLAPGSYADTIVVTAGSYRLEVPVMMQVSSSSQPADAGHLYVLLLDADTGEVVRQAALEVERGIYRYHFEDLDDGSYTLLAGSDADNDLAVCDAGESCGAYPMLDHAVELNVAADTAGLDFSVGPVVSIPAQAAQRERAFARVSEGPAVDKQLTP